MSFLWLFSWMSFFISVSMNAQKMIGFKHSYCHAVLNYYVVFLLQGSDYEKIFSHSFYNAYSVGL